MTEKNKKYTAADFKSYHSGTMPATEMHELEKAALEDPFLADALEGYTYTLSFENDVKELKEKLDEKQKKKNVFFITSMAQSGGWRIAALLIIMAGVGYFFYKMNYKSNENSLAENELKSIVQKKDSSINNKDNTSVTSALALNQQITPDEEKKKNRLPIYKSPKGKETIIIKEKIARAPLTAAEISSESVSDSIKINLTSGKIDTQKLLPFSLRGKVTDENGKPLAFATIKNKSNNEIAVTDTAGRFFLPSVDSNATALVSVVGYGTKKAILQKDKEPVIAMNKSEANLDEASVSFSAKSQKINNAASAEKYLKGEASGDIALPNQALDNTAKFNDYIKENLKPAFDENNNKLNGEILLSFTTDKKGRPHNVRVIKSSCKACEKEAGKLLESGPDWSYEKDKIRTVSIKF